MATEHRSEDPQDAPSGLDVSDLPPGHDGFGFNLEFELMVNDGDFDGERRDHE